MLKWLNYGLLAACIAIMIVSSVEGALAQNCFLWFCPPGSQPGFWSREVPAQPSETPPPRPVAPERQYAAMYAQVDGERFPIPALNLSGINSIYLRQVVYYPTGEVPGPIVIDPLAARRRARLPTGRGRCR
jgi:lipoprotein-anchoring transpeptidase ErfK/SrfK